ncbi:unnamed protein product, partial [Bubo scandiacus]
RRRTCSRAGLPCCAVRGTGHGRCLLLGTAAGGAAGALGGLKRRVDVVLRDVVYRGASGRDTPVLLGQGRSQRSLWRYTISARKQEAPNAMGQACVLCGRAAADPDLCGHKLEKQGLCAHLFCLLFANQLFQQQNKELGLMGFLPEDIRRTVERAAQKQCFVCGESGATITCFQEGCDCSFHLPCAMEGECVTQYLPQYRSFCREHRPEQEVEAAPENDTTCIICLEPVEDRKSYHTMVCPACKHAWFHRGCIQGQATCAGIFFQCPLCRDRDEFLPEMLTMGIRMPLRLPSWENRQADRALIERHRRCNARECLCPRGREQAEERGPWQLLLCSSCAAEGTHRRCCDSKTITASWECESCAGQGTGKRQSTQTSSPSTGSQVASGPSHDSPVLEGSSCSSPPGPIHTRHRSRVQRRAQTPYSRPRRRRGGSRTPAPSAESSTPGQAAPGPSHRSPVPESSSPSTASQLPSGSSCPSPAPESGSRSSRRGPMRMRDRSRVERQAQTPYSRRGRRRGSSRAPSPRAGPDSPPPVQ